MRDWPMALLHTIVLIALIDVGTPSLKVGHIIPWFGALGCLTVKKLHKNIHVFSFLSALKCDVTYLLQIPASSSPQ